MRLKYYLRGLGIGIVVTTVILAISFARQDSSMTDGEVIARARELGMVMEDEASGSKGGRQDIPETEGGSDSANVPDDADNGDAPVDTNAPGNTDVPDGNTGDGGSNAVTQQEFVVEAGDSSNMVSQKLAELGLVDSAEAFNQYMTDNGYADKVLPGRILIRQGATYEEIAQMLTDKELQR